jgi:dTDP-4-amino-4,6-dideoxygalactose transaminase
MIPISSPQFGEEELALIQEVLASGIIAQGPKVAQFEREFAELAGSAHAVAVSSGTAALHVALLAHGIGPGDEVITSPFTFIASANSVLFTGARPIFVDICADTYNLDPALIEAAITPRTKAIMPVHLFGLMADMGPIMEIAARHNLIVIEDAAQAHGATYQGQPAGSFGTGAFSLYATKNMTSAEGGMITTSDAHVDEQCRLLRAHGSKVRYFHDMLGFNFRLTDLHAAVGLAQLHRLAAFNRTRARNAAFLNAHLSRVITPHVPEGQTHVWHQYTVRLPDGNRDAALETLRAAGIGSGVFYPVPIYRQKVYLDLGYDQHLPVTEAVSAQVFSLPVHPKLTQADLDHIVETVNTL